MSSLRSFRLLGLLFAAMLVLAACSDDPTEVVVGSDSVDDSADLSSVADDSPPQPSKTSTTTTTLLVEPVETTTTFLTAEVLDPLGPAMIGSGEWVVLREPAAEAAEECGARGTLAYVIEGEIVHSYDELGNIGGIRLFNGTRGQDAFVINCEESVERVLLQGSAIMPDTGWPELTDVKLYGDGASNVSIAFTNEIAWRGDVFTAYGTIQGIGERGREELLAFDTVTGAIEPLADRIGGTRTAVDPNHEVDVVVPPGWVFDNTDSYVTIASETTFSRIQVERVAKAFDPLAEGDKLLSSDSALTRLWMQPNADGNSLVSQVVDATDTTFLSANGLRLVRHVPVGVDTVEIEMFIDDNESGATQDLPWILLDLIRVIDPSSN